MGTKESKSTNGPGRILHRPKIIVQPRLFPGDYELLSRIAEGPQSTPDRYHALKMFIPIVEKLELEDKRKQDRKLIRLQMPPELDRLIRRRAKETGQTYTHILTEAAREFRRRYPLDK